MLTFAEIAGNDLVEYKKSVDNDVDLLHIYHSIDTKTKSLFPAAYHAFYKAIIDGKTIHFVVRINRFIHPILFFCSSRKLSLTEDQYAKVFKAFSDTVTIINLKEPLITRGPDFIINPFNKWRSHNYTIAPIINAPVYLYYMNKEQTEMAKQFKFNLPYGYSFCEDVTTQEAVLINSKWKNSGPGDERQTAAKIKYMPYGCVKYKEDPVSWVLNDPAGTLTNLYTEPDRRRKGLGLAVEMKAANKIIALNRVPFKLIEQSNKSFLNSTDKGKYWSRWNYDSGEPVNVIVTVPVP
uniref:Glycine N-acyltransferase-like protein n=1 Tax=Rhabditophanes sp. KR3021 TaxID=114890 RepID=A0AC35TQK9_9BILA